MLERLKGKDGMGQFVSDPNILKVSLAKNIISAAEAWKAAGFSDIPSPIVPVEVKLTTSSKEKKDTQSFRDLNRGEVIALRKEHAIIVHSSLIYDDLFQITSGIQVVHAVDGDLGSFQVPPMIARLAVLHGVDEFIADPNSDESIKQRDLAKKDGGLLRLHKGLEDVEIVPAKWISQDGKKAHTVRLVVGIIR